MPNKLPVCSVLFFVLVNFVLSLPAAAATVEYDLVVEQRQMNVTGRPVAAMTVNGSIPGPVLRFREGDSALIRVQNRMDVPTSIHWHGLLVPPGMDGVPFLSFPPIEPGATFIYEFPIRQSGTYWYHSHSGMQEQVGVYGGIVILPSTDSPELSSGDHLILLSDWIDDDPHEVLRTLRRGSEWSSLEKGSGQSILGAARMGMLSEYFSRELQRMPPMDIADIAYDRFLVNGRPEISLEAQPGDIVRLRIVDGSATTYFHLDFAGGPFTVVAADGIDVEPVEIDRFLISVAETYDLLITVPGPGSYEFRATAHDGSGYASVWIGSGERHLAQDIPKPNLYVGMGGITLKRVFALTPAGSMGMSDRDAKAGMFDRPGVMHGMADGGGHGMQHGDGHSADPMEHSTDHGKQADGMAASGEHDGQGMDHHVSMPSGHKAQARKSGANRSARPFGRSFGFLASDISSQGLLASDGMDARRPGTPYTKLRARSSTAFPAGRPVREVRLTLDGDMERYLWFLNNKPLSESDSIIIHRDEIVRFIMINRTMMHHPMHLHGHFFRVLNGQGDRSPLKHTVDVAPMTTTVIEFEANEFGDWFFHCHLLYHMKAGMMRVVHYDGFPLAPELLPIRRRLMAESWYIWADAMALSNMAEAGITVSNTRNIVRLWGQVGWMEEAKERNRWETLLTWERYFNRFFTLLVGVDSEGERSETENTRGVLGLTYLLPLNIELFGWADDDGGYRSGVHKTFELTPRLGLYGEAEYDSHDKWEDRVGLSYMVSKNISLMGQWHSDFGWGGGLQMRF